MERARAKTGKQPENSLRKRKMEDPLEKTVKRIERLNTILTITVIVLVIAIIVIL
jgi:hypothetical protein